MSPDPTIQSTYEDLALSYVRSLPCADPIKLYSQAVRAGHSSELAARAVITALEEDG